ncbi:unnamed protein product [Spirodela intermedia]|uniref:Uncharacterized protein n=1 Tax=Spirodela intermedia TaxID=51605 RepID=A0A7I8KQE4_SPIIN|nr:unnamed protein product [Spirodela intermedia]
MALSALPLWRTLAILFMIFMISSVASSTDEPVRLELSESFSFDHTSPLDTSLATTTVKKGSRCNRITNNICPGIFAKKGTQFLQCCKKNCRNVFTDRNHCGVCGNKCPFGSLCCRGKCTPAAFDANNCGKCGKKCQPGLECLFGICGYA